VDSWWCPRSPPSASPARTATRSPGLGRAHRIAAARENPPSNGHSRSSTPGPAPAAAPRSSRAPPAVSGAGTATLRYRSSTANRSSRRSAISASPSTGHAPRPAPAPAAGRPAPRTPVARRAAPGRTVPAGADGRTRSSSSAMAGPSEPSPASVAAAAPPRPFPVHPQRLAAVAKHPQLRAPLQQLDHRSRPGRPGARSCPHEHTPAVRERLVTAAAGSSPASASPTASAIARPMPPRRPALRGTSASSQPRTVAPGLAARTHGQPGLATPAGPAMVTSAGWPAPRPRWPAPRPGQERRQPPAQPSDWPAAAPGEPRGRLGTSRPGS